eukprot:532438-Pelagomonas_calceolata.AAC.2
MLMQCSMFARIYTTPGSRRGVKKLSKEGGSCIAGRRIHDCKSKMGPDLQASSKKETFMSRGKVSLQDIGKEGLQSKLLTASLFIEKKKVM